MGADPEDWRAGGFGLYVHWPFCASKCPYCDFNSHVAATPVDAARWAAAYRREIARLAEETPGRILGSIYFGGGTPSLMPVAVVEAVLEAARAGWGFSNDVEITLEANPGSAEAGRFAGYRDAGVNRVSLGVQALNDGDLAALGRRHSVAEARAAFDLARGLYARVSFDLIYARQGQDLAAWEAELREALAMAADHLSLYQLTIEPGTAFAARAAAGGLRGLPDEERAADMFELTQDLCAAAGMPAYEVSNHATPGSESRHNLVYWRQGDYVGVGPGAHGRLTIGGRRLATECPAQPGAWLAAAEQGAAELPRQVLRPADHGAEYLMMGLRLSEGICPERYARISGRALSGTVLGELEELGMVAQPGGRLVATPAGRLVLNAVIARLLPG